MTKIIVNGHEVALGAKTKSTCDEATKTKVVERRKSFVGNCLELTDLYADINIQPTADAKIEVVATGPRAVIEQLAITERDKTVSLRGSAAGRTTIMQSLNIGGGISNIISGSRISSVSSFGGVTVITGDDIVINTSDNAADSKVTLEITAPICTEVNLSGITGQTTIGDLRGDVEMDLSGINFAHIQSVRHLNLDLSGQCDVDVDKITGSAKLDLSGSCRVELHSGHVEQLSADIGGACTVEAQVVARRAHLETSGASAIHVKEVTGHCRKDSSGMSWITFG